MLQLIMSFLYMCHISTICAFWSAKWHLGLQHNLYDTILCNLRTQSFYPLLVDDTCSILRTSYQQHIVLLSFFSAGKGKR